MWLKLWRYDRDALVLKPRLWWLQRGIHRSGTAGVGWTTRSLFLPPSVWFRSEYSSKWKIQHSSGDDTKCQRQYRATGSAVDHDWWSWCHITVYVTTTKHHFTSVSASSVLKTDKLVPAVSWIQQRLLPQFWLFVDANVIDTVPHVLMVWKKKICIFPDTTKLCPTSIFGHIVHCTFPVCIWFHHLLRPL